jgi:hypothetical protein
MDEAFREQGKEPRQLNMALHANEIVQKVIDCKTEAETFTASSGAVPPTRSLQTGSGMDDALQEQGKEPRQLNSTAGVGQLKLVLNSDGMLVQQTGEADTFNASAREAFLRRIKSVV